jgi:hypothetical protein
MIKQFSRRALYELIWSKPMREAAAENGISDVGLVKVCRGAAIPTPPQGHWNKVRAGKPTVQIELPPRPPGVPDEVTFGGASYYTAGYPQGPQSEDEEPQFVPPHFEEDLPPILERIRKSVGRVSIPKTMASPHPLIARLLQANDARRKERLESGYSFSWNAPLFESPFERRRLKVLNAIFIALLHEGYKPSIEGKEARNVGVTIGKQHVDFDLDGASQKKPEGWRYDGCPPPQFGPDEKLRMEISHPKEAPEMRWSWLDGDQKLETQLTEIVVCLIYAGEIQYRAHAQSTYEWQLERQQHRREERRKQKEEAERQERLRLERQERTRVQGLFQEANNWRRAREIREYVTAVEKAGARSSTSLDRRRLDDWSRWALGLADRLDPLRAGRLEENVRPEPPS